MLWRVGMDELNMRIELRSHAEKLIKAYKTKAGELILDRLFMIDPSTDEGKRQVFEACMEVVTAYVESLSLVKSGK